jgi:transposase
MAHKPVTTPIPVQLSETEFTAFLFPHLAMPQQGPKGTLGSHGVFHLIVWALSAGRQWKCVPILQNTQGKPTLHDTTIDKVFAIWADDGSLWRAFVTSVQHLGSSALW